MNSALKPILRPPTKYYGGKVRMMPHILPLVPEHRIYVEAFAGGATLFWAKTPSKIEVLSDINGNVTNFYKVMRTQFSDLYDAINCLLHCEHTFNESKEIYNNPINYTPLTRAVAYYVCCNMSYGGEAAGSFQWVRNKTDNWHPAVSVDNRKREFHGYENRLNRVSIRDRKAEILIPDMDCEDTFFYLDPPYVGARQGHYKGYTQDDFDILLHSLDNIKGMFLMSSYENEALTDYVHKNGWKQKHIDQRLGVAGGVGRKIEVLTYNYNI